MSTPQPTCWYVDGRMLKQMLINLVGNAIKFSPKGGSIEIKVIPGRAGAAQRRRTIAVADHGIGIAKDDIPRILKPFEQVETAFARNFDGIGLGLPLVNSMARLHGATLHLDSELNVGTDRLDPVPDRAHAAADGGIGRHRSDRGDRRAGAYPRGRVEDWR